ncbi:MAG: hypothetical protein ACE5HT_15905 [Gemmatimonadales bacterium]
MILMTMQDGQHIDDSDLIRLLDGECEDAEERVLQNHLNGCVQCHRRSDDLARLSERFSVLLLDLDEPLAVQAESPQRSHVVQTTKQDGVVRPWHSRRSLRLLAAVAALVVVIVSVGPAYAWVAPRWQMFRSLIAGAQPAETGIQVSPPVVSFVPAGAEFRIDFARTQAEGTVSIVADSTASASASILGGDGRDELVVLRSGLRVLNRPESSASYHLRLPRALKVVEVRVGGVVVARYSIAEARGRVTWEIDLVKPLGR